MAQSQTPGVIRDTYGEVGLLDMPSAHMAPDGQLAFVAGDIENTERFNLDFQALPWLETSFRYSHYAPGSQNYDRSFGTKIRLFSEQTDFADMAVGIRDILGTGIYSSEYLVVSRHLGPIDVTGGLGWGRLSNTGELPNPLAQIFSSFKTRGGSTATGGTVDLSQFFRGPRVGVFGGLAWATPVQGLSVVAEYSSDKYLREKAEAPNTFPVRSPVNLGLAYRVSDTFSASAGWYYGSSYGLTLAFSMDPTKPIYSTHVGPDLPVPATRDDAEQRQALALLLDRRSRSSQNEAQFRDASLRQSLLAEGGGVRDIGMQGATLIIDARGGDEPRSQCARYARIAAETGTGARTVAVSDLRDGDGDVTFCPINHAAIDKTALERGLRTALHKQGLDLDAVYFGESELWLYYENRRYQKESEAVGRVIRVLLRDAPPSIELFHIFPLQDGVPGQQISVARSSVERIFQAPGAVAQLNQAISLNPAPLSNPVLDAARGRNYPQFSWSIGPGLSEQLFDPTQPAQFRLYAGADASLALAPGLSVGTTLTATIWDDYNFSRPADSVLPHVRTDLLQYLKQGAHGISYLGIDYQMRLAPDVFAETKAGYLEDMYMGVGGQILWRPEGSRFAVGLDAYQVWKRDFDRLFGAQNYNIATGHVTVYYESPWYGVDLAVHAGRYLAGDYGATFEISRHFATGIEVGAFSTFTNVPFSRFGEGSFDKGIFLHIPLEAVLPIFTQTTYGLDLRPLTRDGGQRLLDDDALYEETRRTSYNEIADHFDDLAGP